ncbi:hypothetical protein BDV10DRAFT_164825 [Aspergillus recurvatus]
MSRVEINLEMKSIMILERGGCQWLLSLYSCALEPEIDGPRSPFMKLACAGWDG